MCWEAIMPPCFGAGTCNLTGWVVVLGMCLLLVPWKFTQIWPISEPLKISSSHVLNKDFLEFASYSLWTACLHADKIVHVPPTEQLSMLHPGGAKAEQDPSCNCSSCLSGGHCSIGCLNWELRDSPILSVCSLLVHMQSGGRVNKQLNLNAKGWGSRCQLGGVTCGEGEMVPGPQVEGVGRVPYFLWPRAQGNLKSVSDSNTQNLCDSSSGYTGDPISKKICNVTALLWFRIC